MRFYLNYLFVFFFALSSQLSTAAPILVNSPSFLNNWLSYDLAIGYLGGEANEYVYDTSSGSKISQLNWHIDSAPIIQGKIIYDFLSRFRVTAQGWTTLVSGPGVMDDYDWLIPFQRNFSHVSHSPDTNLQNANELDINLNLWLIRQSNIEVGFLGGYQRDHFSFLANGGCFSYNNGQSLGCFPADQPSIGYKQTFSTAYIGTALGILYNQIEITSILKYSPWVVADDTDNHYLRDITFFDSGKNFKYYNASINAGYYTTPNFKVFVEGVYSHVLNKKADTVIRDNISEAEFFIPNSAGIENKNYTVSLGFNYKFGSPTQCCT